ALLLIPFLRPVPKNLATLFIISMLIGCLNFGLLFVGIANADVSAAAVTGQLGVPMSTIMSMVFLGEKIGWRRALGIALAFAGVVVIAFDPNAFSLSYGLFLVFLAAVLGSAGGIVMKRMAPMGALNLQAWVGLFSFAPLFAISALLETGQVSAYAGGGWQVWFASLFAILGVSVFAHSAFYTLVKRHDVSLLSPLTLMTPLWGVLFGVTLLGEPFTWKLVIGGAVSLAGVFLIAIRPNTVLPEASLGKKIASGDS
ncbi:MAG: DMT family transporter, partial [Alphaproteobacteria bacterium]|nr:DMT family transporter [Alphaproteobacteria bacterium]